MSLLRIVVVEDQPLVRERLVELLHRVPDVEVVGACDNGLTAVARIAATRPDLVLLDIQMPEMNGFDVIEAIGVDRMPPVIFLTAYDMYAVKAFEVQALDYVMKPVSGARIAEVVGRARTRLAKIGPSDVTRHLSALLSRPEVTAQRDRFTVRSGGRIVFVRHRDIDWIEACGNYAIVHLGSEQHTIREPLTNLEQRLGADFKRIHRGTIVNLRRVRELRSAGKGEYDVVLSEGTIRRVTRRFRAALEVALGALD